MGNGDDEKKISSPETEEKYSDKSAEIFSRDLLQSFLGSTSEHESVNEEEIELKLGLSLGGEFGVEKCPKNLVRSSSIASFLTVEGGESDTPPWGVAAQSILARTSSMPVETEDEKRKREQLQSLRRMEAKRRRSDKKRDSKGDRKIEVNWMGHLEREKHISVMKKLESSVRGTIFEASSNLGGGIDVAMAKGKGVSPWSSGGMQGFGHVVSQGSSVESTGGSSSNFVGELEREKHLPVMKKLGSSVGGTFFEASSNLGGGIDVAMSKGKGVYAGGSGGMQGYGQMVSQGSSVESTGGSSSSMSDMESKALQGSSCELSPASTLSFQERSKLDIGSSKAKAKENPSTEIRYEIQNSAKPPADTSRTGVKTRGQLSAVADMPSVYTRGDGPNGRRVDGILYRYDRGEEVRIMCICHGTFHSPAEFVLHAGGTCVDNPLKHIVINPNSSPLL